ncbi:MAG: oxygenase MpaB family protein [Nocardioidaceae bacterium]
MGPPRRGRQLLDRAPTLRPTSLDADGRDGYVADTARVAAALGVVDPPLTEVQLRAQLADYRPELRGTPSARAAARFMLLKPPLPLVVRPVYGVLGAAAVALMPRWTRWPLRLPYLPVTEAVAVRAAGEGLTRTIRWIITPSIEPTISGPQPAA